LHPLKEIQSNHLEIIQFFTVALENPVECIEIYLFSNRLKLGVFYAENLQSIVGEYAPKKV
jgi:hypothetical protein